MEGVNSRFIFRSVEMRNQWGISQCEGKFALLWFHTVNNVDTITPCQHISILALGLSVDMERFHAQLTSCTNG